MRVTSELSRVKGSIMAFKIPKRIALGVGPFGFISTLSRRHGIVINGNNSFSLIIYKFYFYNLLYESSSDVLKIHGMGGNVYLK